MPVCRVRRDGRGFCAVGALFNALSRSAPTASRLDAESRANHSKAWGKALQNELKYECQKNGFRQAMNLTRDEMRQYQRTRRARLKEEALTASNPRSTSIQSRRPPDERPPGSGCRMLPVSPRSTYACGGRAGPGLLDCGPGYPLPPDQFVASPFGRWKANVETMLVALAAKTDAQELAYRRA